MRANPIRRKKKKNRGRAIKKGKKKVERIAGIKHFEVIRVQRGKRVSKRRGQSIHRRGGKANPDERIVLESITSAREKHALLGRRGEQTTSRKETLEQGKKERVEGWTWGKAENKSLVQAVAKSRLGMKKILSPEGSSFGSSIVKRQPAGKDKILNSTGGGGIGGPRKKVGKASRRSRTPTTGKGSGNMYPLRQMREKSQGAIGRKRGSR